MLRRLLAVLSLLLGMVGVTIALGPRASAVPTIVRVGGADRYETAALVSVARFPAASTVFIATGRNFPDALAASATAARVGAPVLLVDTNIVPAVTMNEVRRLRPNRIVVLGGPAAVSDNVLSLLTSQRPGSVERWSGLDRYETAAAVSKAAFPYGATIAYLASGQTFADALIAGAAAGANDGPLLLATSNGLPAATRNELARLHPDRVVIVSSAGAVGHVEDQLALLGVSISHVNGATPVDTAALLASDVAASSDVFLATANAFPDGLTGGVVAASVHAPLLLVDRPCIGESAQLQLDRLAPTRVTVLGGPAAVDPSAANLVPCAAVPPVGQRSLYDRPDDKSGYQVHAMYVVPADGVDRAMDTDGSVERSVTSFNNWLAAQTGGAALRLDTYQGRLDVTFVRLDETDAQIAAKGVFVRDRVQELLHQAGYGRSQTMYAVYYDGSSTVSCGGGALPPALVGNAAVQYLRGRYGSVDCSLNPVGQSATSPGYDEFGMLHEIVHSLGFVPQCAPHQVLAGHVSDDNRDLMYAGPLPWYPALLDVGHDDYYRADVPGCLDLSRSAFLDPSPAGAAAPPGWP